VSEHVDEILLGLTFLEENRCVWHFADRSIQIRGHEYRHDHKVDVEREASHFARGHYSGSSMPAKFDGADDFSQSLDFEAI